jgi:glycosyltransferase involved in cell wall biosynthesis
LDLNLKSRIISVSLIIPAYKDAATLGRAIDSVLAQTRKPDEIIVINDCSPETDSIEEVLLHYPEIVYVKNPVNLGLAASRNVGVKTASGEIICFLDADDELQSQKIEFQLKVYKFDAAVSCLVTKTTGSTSVKKLFDKDFKLRIFKSSSQNILRNTIVGASLMISKDLLMRFGGYDEKLRSSEDFDLWLRLMDGGVYIYDVQLPLYNYYFNENGLSKNYRNISHWEIEVLKKYFNRKGGKFLESTTDAGIWAFWLLKHLLRYEKGKDEKLKEKIIQSIELLCEHQLIRWIILFIQKSRFLKIFSSLHKSN